MYEWEKRVENVRDFDLKIILLFREIPHVLIQLYYLYPIIHPCNYSNILEYFFIIPNIVKYIRVNTGQKNLKRVRNSAR